MLRRKKSHRDLITEKEATVLHVLAQKPATIYALEKVFKEQKVFGGMSHATLYSIIKRLEEMGYIEVKRAEKFRTGLMKKEYAVTRLGFKELIDLIVFYVDKSDVERLLSRICKNKYAKEYFFYTLFKRRKEWFLDKTPKLFREFLRLAGTDRKDEEIQIEELNIPICLLSLIQVCLSIIFYEELRSNQDLLFAILFGDAVDEDYGEDIKELKNEVKEFLKNNPWFKEKIEEYVKAEAKRLREYANYYESLLPSIGRFVEEKI